MLQISLKISRRTQSVSHSSPIAQFILVVGIERFVIEDERLACFRIRVRVLIPLVTMH